MYLPINYNERITVFLHNTRSHFQFMPHFGIIARNISYEQKEMKEKSFMVMT